MSDAIGKTKEAEVLRKNEAKWTRLLMSTGWNALPSILIEKQEALGLDPIDMNIIIHLTNYWWTADNLPHPSVGKIAAAISVKPRTVQKRIKALQELGLLTREERRHTPKGSMTNLYRFDGLIAALAPFAEEKLEQITAAREKEKARLTRKKPIFSVINNPKAPKA